MPKHNTRFTYRHPLIPYAVEYDAMDDPGATEEEADILNDIFPAVAAGDQQMIEPLKRLIQKHPHLPELQNHLYAVYMMGGKRRETLGVLRELRQKHPHYLFGLTNEANQLVQQKKDTAAARRAWMAAAAGEHSLQELLPKVEVLYQAGVVSDDIIGDWAAIVKLFEEPQDESYIEPLPEDISEFYDGSYLKRKKQQAPSKEDSDMLRKIEQDPYAQKLLEIISRAMGIEEEELAPKPVAAPSFTAKPAVKLAATTSPKVGRDEPCPCGSGRKHKHCCGKK